MQSGQMNLLAELRKGRNKSGVELLYSESVHTGNSVTGIEAVSVLFAGLGESILVAVSEVLKDSYSIGNGYAFVFIGITDEYLIGS